MKQMGKFDQEQSSFWLKSDTDLLCCPESSRALVPGSELPDFSFCAFSPGGEALKQSSWYLGLQSVFPFPLWDFVVV